MLFEVSLENFKPFGVCQVAPLSKINLIYGPNSGGKSSLLQALMLMRQTLDGSSGPKRPLIPRGEYVDLGSFRSFLHRHDTSLAFSISLRFDRPSLSRRPGIRSLPKDEPRAVTLSYKAARTPGSRRRDSSELASVKYEAGRGQGLQVKLNRLTKTRGAGDGESGPGLSEYLGRAAFEWASESDRLAYATYSMELERRRKASPEAKLMAALGQEQSLEQTPALPSEEIFANAMENSVVVAEGYLPGRLLLPLPEDLSLERTKLARGSVRGLEAPIESLAEEFELILQALTYLGPLRSHPARHYLMAGGEKKTVGVRGENTPQLIFDKTIEITKQINRWFERFEIPYQMKVRAIGDELTGEILVMQLVDSRTKVEVGPSDVGFGIGQLLPIIVQGLVARGRIICVEQPEIHLHPKLQAHVADLLITTTRSPALDNQWIIETHSEALLLRLQRRIRQGDLPSQDLSVLYVDPGPGGSRILNLRIDENGEFMDEWPGGFFEESFEEIFR